MKPLKILTLLSAVALALSACNKEPVKAAEPTKSAIPAIAGLTEGEGKDYNRLAIVHPVQTKGKMEVLEFFWYGCPHCYVVEPLVQKWKAKLGADVNFVRVPAAWGKPMDEHQKIYYTLQSLNKNEDIDGKVFDAIHKLEQPLAKPEDISAFMVKNGIAKTAWDQAYSSPAIAENITKANTMFHDYNLKGVPYFIINGKYVVGGEGEHALQVVDKIIEHERTLK